jgi:hypothetical protein
MCSSLPTPVYKCVCSWWHDRDPWWIPFRCSISACYLSAWHSIDKLIISRQKLTTLLKSFSSRLHVIMNISSNYNTWKLVPFYSQRRRWEEVTIFPLFAWFGWSREILFNWYCVQENYPTYMKNWCSMYYMVLVVLLIVISVGSCSDVIFSNNLENVIQFA